MKNYRTPVIEVNKFSTENIVMESGYMTSIESYDNKTQLSFNEVVDRAVTITL